MVVTSNTGAQEGCEGKRSVAPGMSTVQLHGDTGDRLVTCNLNGNPQPTRCVAVCASPLRSKAGALRNQFIESRELTFRQTPFQAA